MLAAAGCFVAASCVYHRLNIVCLFIYLLQAYNVFSGPAVGLVFITLEPNYFGSCMLCII